MGSRRRASPRHCAREPESPLLQAAPSSAPHLTNLSLSFYLRKVPGRPASMTSPTKCWVEPETLRPGDPKTVPHPWGTLHAQVHRRYYLHNEGTAWLTHTKED